MRNETEINRLLIKLTNDKDSLYMEIEDIDIKIRLLNYILGV